MQTTSKLNTSNLLQEVWVLQLLCTVVGLILVLLWTRVFKRTLLKQVEQIKEIAEKITDGDTSFRATIYSEDEIGQLAVTFNKMADSISERSSHQLEEVKLSKLINQITQRFYESLDREEILKSAVINTREALNVDRVVIFSFDENWQGRVVAESVDANCMEILGANIYDPCLQITTLKNISRDIFLW
ncbi:MAG: HAMP domain-containing protein [Calothrix sp. SM1_7_51]|nr:HAMP domain-containing protein [Calothrix sp. SM1_7_51]